MRTWKKFRVAVHIFYLFPLEKQINIDLPYSLTIRKSQGIDSLCACHSASTWVRGLQATLSLGRVDSGCGMIHLDCHLGLVEIHFGCRPCRMPCGFLARRRRVICRSESLALRLHFVPLSAKQ